MVPHLCLGEGVRPANLGLTGVEAVGPAFPGWSESHRDAVLQPPQPQIQPSERLLGLTAIRDQDREAAD